VAPAEPPSRPTGHHDGEPDDGELFSDEEVAAWKVGANGWWGGDEETALELLVRVSGLPSNRANIVVMRHPRMLQPEVISHLDASAPPEARDALETVRVLSHDAYIGSLEWPIGLGPLEILGARVMDRVLSLDSALGLAAQIGQRGDAIVPYARAVARFVVRQAHDGHTELSVELAAILLAATRAAPASDDRVDDWTAWRWAADAHVEVARASLSAVPDDRLFWSARDVADEILAWGRSKGVEEERLAWSLVGRYLLDVYTGDKGLESYEMAYVAWQGRRVAAPHCSGPGEDRPMPEPIEALREAVQALRRAVGLSAGAGAGTEWKALVQAQYSLFWIDPDAGEHGASEAERLATARTALEHFHPVFDADKRPFVQLVLGQLERDHGGSADDVSGQAEHELPLVLIAEHVGVRSAVTTGIWRLNQLLERGEPGAAGLLVEMDALTVDHADENLRSQLLHAHVQVLRSGLPAGMTSSDGPLDRRLEVLERLHALSVPAIHADALLGLAATSGDTDEEALGLQLLDRAVALDDSLLHRHPAAMAMLVAVLHYGLACNLGSAEHFRVAIEEYGDAAVAFVNCGLPAKAKHCIRRIGENAAIDVGTATATIVTFARHALELERSLDAHASAAIAMALRNASAQLHGRVPAQLPLIRDEVAKGLRFAAAVASPSPVTLDERACRLLDEVTYLEGQRAGAERAGVADSVLDDEDMLASFVAPSEATPGNTPAEILVNVQRALDEHLATAGYGAAHQNDYLGMENLQALLGERTVLVSLYLGAGLDGGLTVHAQALTHDTYDAAVIPQGMSAGPWTVEHGGVQLTQSPVGRDISELRRRVVEEPMFDEIDEQALAVLASELPRWFGPFAARLADWHASGLDHLVVWPHGPLHFLPWHLFSGTPGAGTIADDWTVTILPTAGVLVREPAPPGEGLVAVASADGGRAFGLSSAATLPAQATAVAVAYGVEPLTEPTRERVLTALPGARFVHLAAHGSHLEEAPAFQCIYLDAQAGSDGRLFSFDVAQLDLRGVELVTLSACESALGRFDISDNLRGLPAALLAAGASAVVGAMWPITAQAATTFFTTLYTRLAIGGDRLSAFRAAQIATRRDHPEYRDWGAMSYVGDWR
jgi:hypothetical protein